MPTARTFATLLVFLGAAGCGLERIGATEGDAGSDASFPDGSAAEASSDALPDTTPADAGTDAPCALGLPGPKMVPADDFCIDGTEVTQADYAKFTASLADGGLDAGDGGVKPPPECGYKKVAGDFLPKQGDPIAKPNRPVTHVDWCDAVGYCRWAGKRLCGKRGGGSLPWATKTNDPTQSQWYAACSELGKRTYAYGANWDKTTCRSDDNGQGTTDVATYPKCVGGYPGLFDMTGNVGEWIDQCQGPAKTDDCKIQGGDYGSNDTDSTCDATQGRSRDNDNDDWIGFRCCR